MIFLVNVFDVLILVFFMIGIGYFLFVGMGFLGSLLESLEVECIDLMEIGGWVL